MPPLLLLSRQMPAFRTRICGTILSLLRGRCRTSSFRDKLVPSLLQARKHRRIFPASVHSFLPIRNPPENLLLPTTPQQPRWSSQVWEWVSARSTDIRFTLGSGGYLRLRNVRVKALQVAGGDARPIDEDSSSHSPDALDELEEESVAVDDPSALLCSGNFHRHSDVPARPLSCSAA